VACADKSAKGGGYVGLTMIGNGAKKTRTGIKIRSCGSRPKYRYRLREVFQRMKRKSGIVHKLTGGLDRESCGYMDNLRGKDKCHTGLLIPEEVTGKSCRH